MTQKLYRYYDYNFHHVPFFFLASQLFERPKNFFFPPRKSKRGKVTATSTKGSCFGYYVTREFFFLVNVYDADINVSPSENYFIVSHNI